jgi:acyl dehydratase
MAELPTVGALGPRRSYGPITRTDIVRYAGASGDFHPLHHDEGYAHKAGFDSVFSMGMFQGGLVASYLIDWLGPEGLAEFSIKFRSQVWPADTLSFSGQVVGRDPTDRRGHVVVELSCANQIGEVVIDAVAAYRRPVPDIGR